MRKIEKLIIIVALCFMASPVYSQTITTNERGASLAYTTDLMDDREIKLPGGKTFEVLETHHYQSGKVVGVQYKVNYNGQIGWIYGHDVQGDSSLKMLTNVEYESSLKSKIGPKPEQSEWDGSVKIVKDWLKQNANDADSIKYVDWSEIFTVGGNWGVRVKFRGKNSFGAYTLNNMQFEIRNGLIVKQFLIDN